ncbi:FecR family protein [Mucilaginibacter frigoritolerans]|uniref:FecR family protein n=1 Tax=Mucilaginibacter frigoritolerans TaxID=652788 RepID=A0A562U274_9SPHI|nr:FecR family protein [Mucilaginibacter frigoritolerans]TWI99813.1 FecR family protein [Mucilaginibacter frigoritolerans]
MNNYQPYFNTGELIAKHLRGELTATENEQLEQWLQSDPHNRELFNKLSDSVLINSELEIYAASEKEKAWENIVAKTGYKATSKKRNLKQLIPYAAAVVLLAAVGITAGKYFLKKEERKTRAMAMQPADLLPGSNKAILKLADGSEIALDDTRKGKIARQQNVLIAKTQNGQIVYQTDDSQELIKNITQYNAIITPRGGQYEVVLPDGTKVWLNSASSLKYPTTFTGADRRVELSGEAYFEVAKNAAKPFFVKTGTQTVEVLGTHFNINSYTDEKAVKTTLLEGSVRVSSNTSKSVVKIIPGEQAVNGASGINIIHDADIDEAMAWKNGKFLFRNTDLQTIMRQLSRWYDVDVEYQGTVAERHYRGRISRNVPVSQVFEILKTSGLNFTINGRKIIVKS